jgi:hypothetical protein
MWDRIRHVCTAALLLAAATGAIFPRPAAAQRTLQWNLQAGDRFRIITAQDVTMQAKVAERSVRVGHRTVVQISWQVTEVSAEQGARIRQSVERLKIQLDAPGGEDLVFDSASGEAPAGPARQIAAAAGPLLKSRAAWRMDARGRITELRLLEDAGAPAEAAGPLAEAFARFLTREGALELSGLSHIALPEKPVGVGDRWQRSSEMRTTAGAFRRETTYELARQAAGDSQLPAKVTFRWTLQPVDQAEPELPGQPEREPATRIEKQDNHGTFLFDTVEGHLVEATVQQRTTLTSQSGDDAVSQQVASELKMHVTRLPKE